MYTNEEIISRVVDYRMRIANEGTYEDQKKLLPRANRMELFAMALRGSSSIAACIAARRDLDCIIIKILRSRNDRWINNILQKTS